ncbi:hypothetical protein ACTFIZ_010496 [Dictyostelium cf. discoideum]
MDTEPSFFMRGGNLLDGETILNTGAFGDKGKRGEHYIEKICIIWFHHQAFKDIPFGISVKILMELGSGFDQVINELETKLGDQYQHINREKHNITRVMLSEQDDYRVFNIILEKGWVNALTYMCDFIERGWEIYDSMVLCDSCFKTLHPTSSTIPSSLRNRKYLEENNEGYNDQIKQVFDSISKHLGRIKNLKISLDSHKKKIFSKRRLPNMF